MRKSAWWMGGALLALVFSTGAAPPRKSRKPLVKRPSPVARLAAATRSLRAAKTLHLRVLNHADHSQTEYWLRKPNLYRVHYPDGSRLYCDGKHSVTVAADGGRKAEGSPAAFPEELRLLDFEPFFGEEGFGEWRGPSEEVLGGKKRRVYWLKTTESAITYGRAFLDPVTLLPIGHHTTEYNDVVTDLYYPLVRLNEAMPEATFRPPSPPAVGGAGR